MTTVPDAVVAMRRWVAMRHLPMLLRFRRRMGYWPDAAWPRTHNERMLWRKIFDHDPMFVTLSDKLAAKVVIAERCPELPRPRVAWSGTDPAELPDMVLDGNFLLKANSGSGDNLNPVGLSRDEVERRLRHWLRRRRRHEEWAYWPIVPQVLAEEMLALGGEGLPTDIKVHVCNGVLTHLWVVDKASGNSLTVDAEGREIDGWGAGYEAPLAWSEQIGELGRAAARLAPKLAMGLDYLRVDFLVAQGELYAGELTLYPAAGFDRWYNPDMAGRLEAAWDIRQSWFVRSGSGPYVAALREAWRP
jgi:hypothetical protein